MFTNWLGITVTAAIIVFFMALLSTYARGYKEGFKDGENNKESLLYNEENDK